MNQGSILLAHPGRACAAPKRRRWASVVRFGVTPLAVALPLLAPCPGTAHAAEPVAHEARAGLDLATAAAAAWSADAVLVYLENDEPLDERGAAPRWGYLFFSPGSQKSRAYSVRDGKILAAEDLEMKLEPPAVTGSWIDSGAALERAEREVGRAFRRDHEGRLATMLLMRGAFDEHDPDRTTWTLIYTSPRAPSLFVVVDAADGKVRKTWRG